MELGELVGNLNLCGGGDSLFGGEDDDDLIGDNSVTVAGILRDRCWRGPLR